MKIYNGKRKKERKRRKKKRRKKTRNKKGGAVKRTTALYVSRLSFEVVRVITLIFPPYG